ncbi:hypothetical protein AVEN_86381-1, partial [Araneus ventricosus]
MDWNMKKFIICLGFVLFSSSCVFSQEFEVDHPSQSYNFVKLVNNYAEHISTSESLKSVSDEEKEFLSGITDIVPNELKTKLLKLFFQLSSSKCLQDLMYVAQSLKTRSEWSLKMLDSFGKPESGLLIGNLKWIGEYDECLGIKAPRVEYTSIGGFRGRYCTLQIPLTLKNMSLPVSTAVCLPDSCNPNGTIASIFGNIFKDFNLKNFTSDDSMDEVFGNMTLSCKPTTRKLTSGAITV